MKNQTLRLVQVSALHVVMGLYSACPFAPVFEDTATIVPEEDSGTTEDVVDLEVTEEDTSQK